MLDGCVRPGRAVTVSRRWDERPPWDRLWTGCLARPVRRLCRAVRLFFVLSLRDEVPGSAIKTKKQYVIAENDLLVAEIDAKAGAYGIVPGDLTGCIVSGHYFTYQVDTSIISPQFLDHWLKTPAAHTQVLEFIRGSLNYAAIRPNHFPQIRIPMPSLDVQAHIVGKIDEISSRSAEASRLRESIDHPPCA